MIWLLKEKTRRQPYTTILNTSRFQLRPACREDHAQWAMVRNRNYSYLKPFEPEWPRACLEKDFFERRVVRLEQDWRFDRTYAFLIFEDGAETLIGGININNVTRGAAQFGALGYWLSEEAQGKGAMTEAAHAALTYAFKELGLARMNAATLVHNAKSRAMLQRLGFSEEGFAKKYIQIDGRRQDHVLYGLDAQDFLSAS